MPLAPPELIPDDLAPGDATARQLDWSGLALVRIRDVEHPLFGPVYTRLRQEFAPRGEMEREEVIAGRLAWQPTAPIGGHALLYEMIAVVRGEELIAMRDHTAIVARQSGHVVVHLSHVLIEAPLRGTGLAGWLRAFPIQAGRECARAAGGPAPDRITLVAEMEHPDGVTPTIMARLRSYDRAGFLKIDPNAVPYCQPDFRAPAAIDAGSVQSIPLALLVRRVGREHETTIPGAEVREIVQALYTMFGIHVRAGHMAPLWSHLERLRLTESVALRRPLDA